MQCLAEDDISSTGIVHTIASMDHRARRGKHVCTPSHTATPRRSWHPNSGQRANTVGHHDGLLPCRP